LRRSFSPLPFNQLRSPPSKTPLAEMTFRTLFPRNLDAPSPNLFHRVGVSNFCFSRCAGRLFLPFCPMLIFFREMSMSPWAVRRPFALFFSLPISPLLSFTEAFFFLFPPLCLNFCPLLFTLEGVLGHLGFSVQEGSVFFFSPFSFSKNTRPSPFLV